MSKQVSARLFAAVSLAATVLTAPLYAGPGHDHDGDRDTRHVLLISIDGMHAVDYENCVASGNCPTLAALGRTGVNYTRTTTSRPSDSFPGLLALVTGGSPKTVGGFYDVAYDRVLAPPLHTTGNGLPGTADDPALGPCVPNQVYKNSDGSTGTQTEYEEGDEFDETQLNGRFAPAKSPLDLIDGNVTSINPQRLIRDPFNNCQPVYPWNFIRTNTIYGVIHSHGGFTAWSDKHAVYALVSGPTGTDKPSNVDDYYSPEVNSFEILLPGIKTAAPEGGASFDCRTPSVSNSGVKFPITNDDWTVNFDAIKCYDQLKVNAVVNWINGKNHLGTAKQTVPVIFGMNFQAVSVGQKLIAPKSATRTDVNSGGYEDASGAPRPLMAGEIAFVDAAIGQMVAALKSQHLFDSTTIIITAKHGQSPIDPNRFYPIPGNSGTNGTPPSGVIGNLIPQIYSDPLNALGIAEDDISQLWLTDSSKTAEAVADLEAAQASSTVANQPGLGQIYFGGSLTDLFNAPGLPNVPGPCCKLREGGDPRTPDIVVIPNVGVVYTGNLKKQSEHGGYAWDDTNVMLLVSHPHLHAKTL
ncbi:MAG TPA: alkaline phosphatase family protein, partial [Candidatus Acidoferrum sp.]|nr:alkaline phosphatase family protein [Candidatus Acidoferrum sp.]